MIIINFIIDYLVMIFLPINTYFILNDLDKNKLFSIFLVGILVDIMFNKLFVFLFILIVFYLVLKKLKVKKKYYYIKNIIIFLLFYLVVTIINNSFNLLVFSISFILQIIYMIIYKELLK